MASLPAQPEKSTAQILSGDSLASGSFDDSLLPVRGDATIEEIVMQVRASGSRHVELLVPDRATALSDPASCATLREVLAEAGVSITIFSADRTVLGAAKSAGIEVIAVGSSVVTEPEDLVVPQRTSEIVRSPTVTLGPPVPSRGARQDRQARAARASRQQSDDVNAVDTRATRPIPGIDPAQLSEQSQRPDANLAADPLPTEPYAYEQKRPAVLPDDRIGERAAPPGAGTQSRRTQMPPAGVSQGARDVTLAPDLTTIPEWTRPVPGTRRSAESTRTEQSTTDPGRTAIWGRLRRQRGQKSVPGSASISSRSAKGASMAPARGSGPRLLALVSLPVMVALAWFGIPLLGVGGGSAVLLLTPAAPVNEVQRFTGLVVPVTPGPASGAIAGRRVSGQSIIRMQGEATGSAAVPIGRATGSLILRNRNAVPVTLRAGQVVPAANGVMFTIDSTVTVPAAMERIDGSGVTYGQGTASLTAMVPGSDGNIPAGAISTIPGVEVALRIEHGPFSGGSDQQVQLVRTEDVNRVLPEALSQLWAAGQAALREDLAGATELTLVTESITPTVDQLRRLEGVAVAVFPPVGAVASDGRFTLELRTSLGGVAQVSGQAMQAQLAEAARQQLVAAGKITNETEVVVTSWTMATDELLVDVETHPSGRPASLGSSFLEEVQVKVRGLPRDQATAYLQSLVEQGKIAAFSEIPEGWERVPERIRVQAAPQ